MNINNYIGIPFIDRGRSMIGADCWGVVYLFYKHEKNITLPILDSYSSTKDTQSISEIIDAEKPSWQAVDEPEEGDVIVFTVGGFDTHVGVYIGRNRFLHAFKGTDSCIERLDSPTWKNRINGYYQYAE